MRQLDNGRSLNEVLAGEVVDRDSRFLAVGTPVLVYRTHQGAPHWFYGPSSASDSDEYSMEPYVEGVVREARCRAGDDGVYRVTVCRNGRELYLDWMDRYWVRLPGEEPPTYPPGMQPVSPR